MRAAIQRPLLESGQWAFCWPGSDLIHMPPRAASERVALFNATLAHEASHWTRHPSRLDRDFGQTRFGDPAYALEELVTEVSAASIGANFGLPTLQGRQRRSGFARLISTNHEPKALPRLQANPAPGDAQPPARHDEVSLVQQGSRKYPDQRDGVSQTCRRFFCPDPAAGERSP